MKNILITSIESITELLMKHMLITLAVVIAAYFLFFSHSSSAEETWAKTNSGCLISSSSNTEVKQASWTGACKDGYTSGEGTLKVIKLKEGVDLSYECTGTMAKGEIHGKAACTVGDSTTTGNWEHGHRNGFATTKWDDGSSYAGTWKDDKKVAGIFTLADGKKIKLKWFEEKNGCLVWNSGPQPDEEVTWDGACLKGYGDGEGTLTFTSKDMKQSYSGILKNGKKEGQGTYRWLKHSQPCNEKGNIYYCYKEFVGKFTKDDFDTGMYTLISGKKVAGKSRFARATDKGYSDLMKVLQGSFEVDMAIRESQIMSDSMELLWQYNLVQ